MLSSAASDQELNLQPLSRKEEKSVLRGLEVARGRGDIFFAQLEEPTLVELRSYLTEHLEDKAPHVVHFDGHGLFGQRCPNSECGAMNGGTKSRRCRKCDTELPLPQGYLVFEDEDGDANYSYFK